MTSPNNPRRPAGTVRKAKEPTSRRWVIPAVIGGAVLVFAVIAVVLAGGSDDSKAIAGQVRDVSVQGAALPTLADSGSDPAVGMTIPTLTGESFDGTPVTVGATGSPQLLLFVAHWCPHCQREVPLLSEWMKSGGMPAGVQLTTIATGTSPEAPNYPPSAWLAKNDWPSPIMADSAGQDAANAFGLPGYPYFVLVDGDGKVVARTSGEISTDQLETMLQQLVAKANG